MGTYWGEFESNTGAILARVQNDTQLVVHQGQLGPPWGPTWGRLGVLSLPPWANMGPTWSQLEANAGVILARVQNDTQLGTH